MEDQRRSFALSTMGLFLAIAIVFVPVLAPVTIITFPERFIPALTFVAVVEAPYGFPYMRQQKKAVSGLVLCCSDTVPERM